MTKDDSRIDELDLQAYADGRLDRDPHRKAVVEAYLDENPAEQERVRSYRIIGEQIRAAYREPLDEPVPQRFADLLMADDSGAAARRRPSIAATAALVFVAAFGGWLAGNEGLNTRHASPDVSDVVENHRAELDRAPDFRREVVAASPATSSRKPETLVIEAPDLNEIGYSLDRTESAELADAYRTTLFYRDREGDVITLVLERPKEPADTAPTIDRDEDLQSAHWRDGALRVVAVGDRIEPNIDKIRSAVDQAFQKIEKAAPPKLPLGAPFMAEDSTRSLGGGAPAASSNAMKAQ